MSINRGLLTNVDIIKVAISSDLKHDTKHACFCNHKCYALI